MKLLRDFNVIKIEYESNFKPIGTILKASFPSSINVKMLIDSLEKLSEIKYVAPIVYYKVNSIPNDPKFNEQWALTKCEFDRAWDIAKCLGNVTVAVIDTGIDLNHEDLAINLWRNNYS